MMRRNLQQLTYRPQEVEPPSVVVPTYNREEYLCRAIGSVEKQKFPAREIIIVDDGSTDHTESTVSKLKRSSSTPIHYLKICRSGVSAARNVGVDAAKSKWIAFLDVDDEWQPHKIKSQLDFLKKNPTCLVVHTNELWKYQGKHLNQKKYHRKSGGYLFERCLERCLISPSSVLIRKDLIEDFGYFDAQFTVCEDYEFWLYLTSYCEIGYIDAPLVIKHGGHANQLSQKYKGMDSWRILAIAQLLGSGHLSQEQTLLARNSILRKYKSFSLGMEKHGRKNLLEIVRGIMDFQCLLSSSDSTNPTNLDLLAESLKTEMASMADLA